MVGAGRKVAEGHDVFGCPIWIDVGACDFGDASFTCEPIADTTNYVPLLAKPPRTPEPNACTLQQIASFAACWSTDTGQCDVSDASTCDACLVSQPSDAAWGALVLNGTAPVWNVGGCVDLVLGTTSSCGDRVQDATGCLEYACALCPEYGSTDDQCEAKAAQTSCKSYVDAMKAACSPDSSLPDTSACMDNPAITDRQSRARDFITRLATLFCGP